MSEKENVQILKEGYALWNDTKADSVGHWMNLIADDVKWNSLGNGATGMEFTVACNGKADVQRYFNELGKQWAMIFYTVDEYVAQGDRVVALARCRWRHRGTGVEVESPKADVFRMKNSKVVEFFEFYDTAQLAAAAQEK